MGDAKKYIDAISKMDFGNMLEMVLKELLLHVGLN